MGPRIVVIGGGSAYMPGIAFAFAKASATFPDATLVLHDHAARVHSYELLAEVYGLEPVAV